MGTDQLKELKKVQKENQQLHRAVADLTLDSKVFKPPPVPGEIRTILTEAARGDF